MRKPISKAAMFLAVLGSLTVIHLAYISLPYFWDEAGYYIPAAWDIYKSGSFIPVSTLPNGHVPMVMVCLALAWHVFGYSPAVSRVVMLLFAAAVVAATYSLARRFLGREPAAWCSALLGLSPLFFAQSSLVFLDLPAALFTTLAVLALTDSRWWRFTLAASLAVLTKETTVVILPLAWIWVQRQAPQSGAPVEKKEQASWSRWLALFLPLLPLMAWTLYYRHKTGFWTGNAEYLKYNLGSTMDPARVAWSLLRRLYEILISGFDWILVTGAAVGARWGKQDQHGDTKAQKPFYWLAGGLIAAYVVMHSVVGGAVLPRYLLPAFPVFFVACAALIWRLPRNAARGICTTTAACFVAAWFINPPYPFAFENNLAYADFIRLHQDAAQHLESRHASERVLTAWPATDEISRPFLGYVATPLPVLPVEGFSESDFERVSPESFDVLYLYSRKWEPPRNWLERFPVFLEAQRIHFGYSPQISDEVLVHRYGLVLEKQFERRGQWVRIYSRK